MANRLISRLAWATAGAAIAVAPQLLRIVRRAQRVGPIANDADRPIQQITRYRDAHGAHSIHGTLLAEFHPGERSATLVVAFCPPFERLPRVEAEAVDDADASVKVTQLLHNGAQFEVRLPQPASVTHHVTLELMATDADVSET